jgi:O-antigen/teichoic acid export membrane protein
MTSLKTNVVWNVVRVGANMLFPIITLPYINRVLGPYNIGINIVLIPILSYKSIIISVIISESIVLLMHHYYSQDYIDIKILDFINLKILVAALLSGFVASAMANFVDLGVGLFSLTTKIIVIALLYPLLLFLQKDNSFVELLKTIKIR